MDLRALRNAAPPWSTLQKLASNPKLRWSPLWLIIVPAAVKGLVLLREKQILSGSAIPLPVAVELLFYSGIAVAAAAVVYSARCPAFIKNYQDYEAFKRTGKNINVLLQEFAEGVRACKPPLHSLAKNLEQMTVDLTGEPLTQGEVGAFRKSREASVQYLLSLRLPEAKRPDVFWVAYRFLDDLRPASRYLHLLLVGMALLCVAIVLLRNLGLALRYITVNRLSGVHR